MTPTPRLATDRRTMIAAVAMTALGGGILRAAPAHPTPAPAPRTVGGITRLDPALDAVIDADTPVEVLATGYRWAEGPAWSRAGGFLLFSDVPANVAHRWTPDAGAAPWLDPSGLAGAVPDGIREAGSNGLAFAADGALLVANSGGRSVDRIDMATGRRTVIADRFEGRRFNSPNDLFEAADGSIYFTDPPYGLDGGDDSPLREQRRNGIYRIDPRGRLHLLDGDQARPNGLAPSPDGRILYVALSEEDHPRILAYDLGADGGVSNRRLFADMRGLPGEGSADGLKVDRAGRLFATGPGGVHILDPAGRRLGLVSTGKAVANVGFGEDGRSLFLTSTDMLARVRLRASGW